MSPVRFSLIFVIVFLLAHSASVYAFNIPAQAPSIPLRWYDRIYRVENRVIDDAIITWGRVGEEFQGKGGFTIEAPILTYHQVRNIRSSDPRVRRRFITSPKELDSELAEIENEGYTVVSLNDLVHHLASSTPYSSTTRPLVLTFDDGFKNQFTQALPILTKHKVTATFFVCPGILDVQGDTMTWKEVAALEKAGMTVGNHTLHHAMLTQISSTSTQAMEILDAGMRLEKHLGHKESLFAYPYGKYDDSLEKQLKDAGYSSAVSVDVGRIQSPARLFALKRFDIGNDHSIFLKAIRR